MCAPLFPVLRHLLRSPPCTDCLLRACSIVAWQDVSALLPKIPLTFPQLPSAGTYALAAATLLLFLLQGAGIWVDYGGEATLTNTNVYENEAGQGEDNQGNQGSGGGLRIDGTATLTNTNVYANKAQVCWSFARSLSFHPAPAELTHSLFLAGRRRTFCAWHSDIDRLKHL